MTDLLMILLMIGVAADLATTIYGIKRAGLREANWLPAGLMERFGTVPVVVVAKWLMFSAGLAAMMIWPEDGRWWAAVVIAGHIFFAARNALKIVRARRG